MHLLKKLWKLYFRDDDEEETFGRFLLDVVVNCVVIIILYLSIFQPFIAAPFQVDGHSMDATLNHGEYILISKIEYLVGEPLRGDIIVFHPPERIKDSFIKRVIGIPGDRIELKEGGVLVNGKNINEPYLSSGVKTCLVANMPDCRNDEASYLIPEGKYFVLGDNRPGSQDSRAWMTPDSKPNPFIDREQIQGKARIVWWPPQLIRLIPATRAFEGL